MATATSATILHLTCPKVVQLTKKLGRRLLIPLVAAMETPHGQRPGVLAIQRRESNCLNPHFKVFWLRTHRISTLKTDSLRITAKSCMPCSSSNKIRVSRRLKNGENWLQRCQLGNSKKNLLPQPFLKTPVLNQPWRSKLRLSVRPASKSLKLMTKILQSPTSPKRQTVSNQATNQPLTRSKRRCKRLSPIKSSSKKMQRLLTLTKEEIKNLLSRFSMPTQLVQLKVSPLHLSYFLRLRTWEVGQLKTNRTLPYRLRHLLTSTRSKMRQDQIRQHTGQTTQWPCPTLYIICIKDRCQRRAAKWRPKDWYFSRKIHVNKSQPSLKTQFGMRL